MADIEFKCPACTKSLVIDAKGASKMIKCPDCGASVQVPMKSGQPQQNSAKPAAKPSPDIQFKCQYCGRALRAPSERIGQTCRCPDCGKNSTVPNTVAGKECPHCQNRVKVSTHLCIKCGFNFSTGKMPGWKSHQSKTSPNSQCSGCGSEIGKNDILCLKCGLNQRTGVRYNQWTGVPYSQFDDAREATPDCNDDNKSFGRGILRMILSVPMGISAWATSKFTGRPKVSRSAMFITGGLIVVLWIGSFIFGGSSGCSRFSSGKEWVSAKIQQSPNNKPSDAFKTSIMDLLIITGELEAQTEGGVARREFSQSLAKVKSKAEIVFAIWPGSFLPDAKEELQRAIYGWDLALALWMNDEDVKVIDRSSALGQEIENYGVGMYGLAKSVVPRIFNVASSHYSDAKTQLLKVLSQ